MYNINIILVVQEVSYERQKFYKESMTQYVYHMHALHVHTK